MQDVLSDTARLAERETVVGTGLPEDAPHLMQPADRDAPQEVIADRDELEGGSTLVQSTEETQHAEGPEHIKVSLNSATAQDLQSISGIGPAFAERILEYRSNVGTFLSKDELLAVPGIGPALYDSIADHLTVVPPDEVIGEEAAPEPTLAADAGVSPQPEAVTAPREAFPEPVAPREQAPGPGLQWLWSALLGALLGVVATLVILAALNGSLVLHQAPVIVDMNQRIEGLSADIGQMRGELETVQQRLTVLEALPSRMDAVEGTVGQLDATVSKLDTAVGKLDSAVNDLEGQTATLSNRVDQAEGDIAAVQKRADRVDGFFQELQTLLSDVFGAPAQPSD